MGPLDKNQPFYPSLFWCTVRFGNHCLRIPIFQCQFQLRLGSERHDYCRSHLFSAFTFPCPKLQNYTKGTWILQPSSPFKVTEKLRHVGLQRPAYDDSVSESQEARRVTWEGVSHPERQGIQVLEHSEGPSSQLWVPGVCQWFIWLLFSWRHHQEGTDPGY